MHRPPRGQDTTAPGAAGADLPAQAGLLGLLEGGLKLPPGTRPLLYGGPQSTSHPGGPAQWALSGAVDVSHPHCPSFLGAERAEARR